MSFEKLAIRALAGLGGLGVVVAGFFFYDLAVERGFITPGIRYALGLVLGIAMLGGAEVLWKRDYRIPGAALSGAGLGVLYAALYAGVTRYELMGVLPTFALMAAVTATSTLLAVRHGSLFLAILGAIGGYGTPIMLSTGQNKAVALFTYVALLNAGLLLAASRRRWPVLVGLAALATLALELGWSQSFYTSDQIWVGLGAPLVLGAGFGLLAARKGDDGPTTYVAGGAALATLVGILPWLIPVKAPFDGPGGPSEAVMAGAGALALLVAVGALQALARWRDWQPLALAAAGMVGLPLLAFAIGHQGAEPPPLAVVSGLFLALPLLIWAVGPAGKSGPVALCVSAACFALSSPMIVSGDAVDVPVWSTLVSALGLTGIALAMAAARRFSWAPMVGLAVTGLTQFLLAETFLALEAPGMTLILGGTLIVLFLAFPFVLERMDASAPRTPGPWLTAALAAPVFFLPMYDAWERSWGDTFIGALPVALGLAALLAVKGILARRGADAGDRDLALFTAVALLFLAAAIPIQLEKEWLTLGWALEIAALAWVRGRLTHPLLTPFALVLAVAVSVRLLLNGDALDYHPVEGPTLVNWISYTWGIPALCLLYAAGRLKDAPQPAPQVMRIAAILMLFTLVNLQVSHAFAEDGSLELLSDDFVEEMTRSLAWAAFGLMVLVAGVFARSRMVRIVAFLFLLLAAGKVFLSDLASLGGLARVGSLLGLSVFLLVSAVLFRWLDKKLESESSDAEGS